MQYTLCVWKYDSSIADVSYRSVALITRENHTADTSWKKNAPAF